MSLAACTQLCGPWFQAQETCPVLGGKEDLACWTPHHTPPQPRSRGAGGAEGPTEPPPPPNSNLPPLKYKGMLVGQGAKRLVEVIFPDIW